MYYTFKQPFIIHANILKKHKQLAILLQISTFNKHSKLSEQQEIPSIVAIDMQNI